MVLVHIDIVCLCNNPKYLGSIASNVPSIGLLLPGREIHTIQTKQSNQNTYQSVATQSKLYTDHDKSEKKNF